MARSSLRLDPVTLRRIARRLASDARDWLASETKMAGISRWRREAAKHGAIGRTLVTHANLLRSEARLIEAKQKRGRSAKKGPRP